MKDLCGCYYPEEYNDWYKENKFGSEDSDIKSNIKLQTRPECYSPECQQNLTLA